MVSKLVDPNQLAAAKAAFHAVFRRPDPFNEPFHLGIPERLILWPISYELEEHEYAALNEKLGTKNWGQSPINYTWNS